MDIDSVIWCPDLEYRGHDDDPDGVELEYRVKVRRSRQLARKYLLQELAELPKLPHCPERHESRGELSLHGEVESPG